MTLSNLNPKVFVYGAPARRSAGFPFVLTKDMRILGTVSKSQIGSKVQVDWLEDLLIALEGTGKRLVGRPLDSLGKYRQKRPVCHGCERWGLREHSKITRHRS